jgi:prepilin-type N-terminal cleavage/methylation domain-containing protein
MRTHQDGFSLIELLIVVAILGLVGMIAIPSLSNTFRFSVQTSAREIATLVKDTANSAQITGRVHRIAYDLKNDQYWVESTSESTLLKSDESKEKDREHHSVFDADTEKKSGFHQENSLTKKKRSLSLGVKFKDVYTEQGDEAITDGLAYTHIFPQGMSETSLVHLIDTSGNQVSLVVTNLLGRCQIEGHYLEPKEVFHRDFATH